jgi:hypothetical protein
MRRKEVSSKLDRADPKPSDLIVDRLKMITKLEDRTGDRRKVLGRFTIRGERLIKLGNIWFFAKYILV